MTSAAPHASARDRLLHEIRSYAQTTLYLVVCFGAVQIYRAAVLTEESVHVANYSFALAKAVVIAKFMMVGEAVKATRRIQGEPLWRGVLRGSLLLMLILFALTVVEELLVGAFRGLHPGQVLHEHVDGGRWAEFLAHCLLLWMILLPYLTLKHMAEVMGPEAFRRVIRGQG